MAAAIAEQARGFQTEQPSPPRSAVGGRDTSNLAWRSLETLENKGASGPWSSSGSMSSREIAAPCYLPRHAPEEA